MKEKYESPVLEVIECEVENGFMVSSVGFGSGYADNDLDALSNGHRGEWGDLW